MLTACHQFVRKKSSALHRALLCWLGRGWRGSPWPLTHMADGCLWVRAGGWWPKGSGGAAHRSGCSWPQRCSLQRALPTRLKLLGYKAYQRPSCSVWPSLPNKISICKEFENKPCVLVAEMNFKFWAEVQEYWPSASHNTSDQRTANCLTWTKLTTSLKELLWAG